MKVDSYEHTLKKTAAGIAFAKLPLVIARIPNLKQVTIGKKHLTIEDVD